MPPESIDAIEPPPAAMLDMSRLRNAMRWPASPPSADSDIAPSAIREMSVEVPPMSKATRSGILSIAEQRRQPDMPPAGPDSTAAAASRAASATGAMPPWDRMMKRLPAKPASCRRRSRPVR
jgi:hypothetical protein